MGLITISVALALKENSIGQLQWKSTIKGAWRNKGLNREKLNSTARPWRHQLGLIKLHTYFSFQDLMWETIFELTDLKSLVTAVEKRGENSVTSIKNKRERTRIPTVIQRGRELWNLTVIKRERTLKSDLDTKGENSVTWLSDFDIKDFLHVFIVGGDLEHGTGRVLDTRDVDRDDVSRHSLPSHVVPVAMDSKNLGPQSVQTKKK